MTQDYRKRAEDLWAYFRQQEPREYELDRLVSVFKEIANEARREENEACAKIADKCGENTADTKYRFGIIIASWLISETIRSRMIGPEPMEEK